jgi:hypothetical protein
MKIRLLVLTSPDFSPFDVLLTERPSYTQTEGGSAGFAKASNSITTSCESKPLFKKSDTIFPFSSDLKYSCGAIAEDDCPIHYVSSLNV